MRLARAKRTRKRTSCGKPACNPDVGHVFTARRIKKLGGWVGDGTAFDAREVDRDHVGAFSDFQRTDFIVPVKGARAAERRGLEHVEDLRAGGAARDGLGEHGREARPEDIEGVFAALDAEYGDKVECILYGGSVNQGNAEETLQVKGVNGLFVGRSAWQVDGYLELLRIAAAQA